MLVFGVVSSVGAVLKPYDESLPLNCPSCDDSANKCSANINGINTTLPATDGQIILPSRNWNVFGDVCCGTINQHTCYTVCPRHTGKKCYPVTQ